MNRTELLERYREGDRVFDNVILRGEDLEEVNLQGASLVRADLRHACLRRAWLMDVDFQGAQLACADLREADLTGARNLYPDQLGGADLGGAKISGWRNDLPEVKMTNDLGKTAQTVAISLVGACAYAFLALATTTDAALLTNSASFPLPVVGTAIPIVGFYVVAPILLVSVFWYLAIVLQRFWEGLARVPAVFPDGSSVDQRLEHSLFIGFARSYMPRLDGRTRPPLVRVQTGIAIGLAWVSLPITLFAFSLRYLPRQDPTGTALHLVLWAIGAAGWLVCWRLARWTLAGRTGVESGRSIVWWCVANGLIAGILILAVVGRFFGDHPDYERADRRFKECQMVGSEAAWWRNQDPHWKKKVIPCVFGLIRFDLFPTFEGVNVSGRPPNWRSDMKKVELEAIGGANLRCAPLRFAQGYRAFLGGAILRRADLRWADLERAILDGADLQRADLRNAKLGQASLRHANLEKADLRGASMKEVNLEGAELKGARLDDEMVKELIHSGSVTEDQSKRACTDERKKNCDRRPAGGCHVVLFGREADIEE